MNHIIHRDLKSENIFVMLNERKEIMRLAIGDFDTAKKVSSKNQAKTVLGTPQVDFFSTTLFSLSISLNFGIAFFFFFFCEFIVDGT